MKNLVKPFSGDKINITAPPSKSYMQRAVAATILSGQSITLSNYSKADDCLAALDIAKGFGYNIEAEENSVFLEKRSSKINTNMFCRESGLCIRMFSPIAALYDREIELTGEGSLTKRPLAIIEKPLRDLGAKCFTNNGFLPVRIKGPISKNEVEIDGKKSSQFLSGLLLALPTLKNDSTVFVKNLKSRPYIDMTMKIMNDFNVEVQNNNYEVFKIKGNQKYLSENYSIEGDWSGGAFFLVAGAILGKSSVSNLSNASFQGDKNILNAIKSFGGEVNTFDQRIEVLKGEMRPFEFDATECPDLFPPLVVLALFSNGVSSIKGVSRLKGKESDRGEVLKKEFSFSDREIEIIGDEMKIKGSSNPLSYAVINSHNDHRIAMAGAICALKSKTGLTIENSECVKKSYPDFFTDLCEIGVQIECEE